MRSSMGYVVGIVLTIGVGAVLQYYFCCGPSAGGATVSLPVVTSSGMPFHLQFPDGDFEYHTEANFDFPYSSYSFLLPLPNPVESGIAELKNFLEENEDVSLVISGFGYPSEDNHSAFPTLGEARANSVKSELIERGIPGKQLSVRGEIMNQKWSGQDSIIRGPIAFTLLPPEVEVNNPVVPEGENATQNTLVEPTNFSEFVLNLQENPMVLYFETGSAYVSLSAAERETISRLNQYLDQNSDARIVVHGHTDNAGSPAVNTRLAMERAEFLKAYLVRNGFRPDRIETVSHGQTTPVAPNDTPEGMAKNRRAVLTIDN